MTDDVFEVDADELLHVVDRMAACEAGLRDLADRPRAPDPRPPPDLAGRSRRRPRRSPRQTWDRGFRDMRDALHQMRAAAHTAHDNYTGAADTNLRLWEQVG